VGELEKYKIYSENKRLGGKGYQTADNCKFFYGKGKVNHQLRTGFFVYYRIFQQLKGYNFLVTGCFI
jgi:hypothetical protein